MISTKLVAKALIEDYKKKESRFPRATNSAINKVTAKAKTFISKQIRATYNIKAVELNKNFKLKKSTWKTLTAQIDGIGQGISLTKFGAKRSILAKKTSSGLRRHIVEAKIKKIGGKKFIPDTFQMKSTFAKRVGEERLPVKKAFGPGVAVMFNKNIKNEATIFIQNNFPAIIENEIKYFNE